MLISSPAGPGIACRSAPCEQPLIRRLNARATDLDETPGDSHGYC